MNGDNLVISRHMLQKFVDGDLSENDAEKVLAHLAVDEDSLAVVDELWEQQELPEAALAMSDLEAERAQRIEKRVIQNIHRSNLALSVASLGTKGFFAVALSIMKPLADNRRSDNTRSNT